MPTSAKAAPQYKRRAEDCAGLAEPAIQPARRGEPVTRPRNAQAATTTHRAKATGNARTKIRETIIQAIRLLLRDGPGRILHIIYMIVSVTTKTDRFVEHLFEYFQQRRKKCFKMFACLLNNPYLCIVNPSLNKRETGQRHRNRSNCVYFLINNLSYEKEVY